MGYLKHLLQGKKIIIVGGSSGIDKAVAAESLSQGTSVVVSSSSQTRVEAAMAELKAYGSVVGAVVDIKDTQPFTEFLSEHGKFDHLIYTAGGTLSGTFPNQEINEAAKEQFDYWAPMIAAQCIHKYNLIYPGGSITMTMRTVSNRSIPGWKLVSRVAGATESATRGLAFDLKPIRFPQMHDYNFEDTRVVRYEIHGKLTPRFLCDAGTTASGGKCVACPTGTYSIGGSSPCKTCPTGSTSTTIVSDTCACIAGYVNIDRHSAADTFCAACPAGKSSSNNASICTPCLANTFSISGGLCNVCPSGTSSVPGSSSCAVFSCLAGQHISGNSCATCPAGSYSNKGAVSCLNCPAGTISSPRSNTCTVCGAGLIPTSGRNSCISCPVNTYSNGDVCSPCPAGSTSSPGGSSCGPQPSKWAEPPVQRAEATCLLEPGQKWCPILSGKGGYECIDTPIILDSCGGCAGVAGGEGEFAG